MKLRRRRFLRLAGSAPKDTPAKIGNKLNEAVNTALADPDMRKRLADVVYEPVPMAPADFVKFIADETEKWGNVVRAAHIQPV